ncbi:MAG: UDP-N-acetylmuramoyl-tripeptide--D-alanyl-D-alanine ligase, partial [Clostridiales bacterium]|nr:UDP-N-acetylmuramoyl-tripeptide--D-alanyl-D-alanine ligase [Clostridiales bacterium]
TTTIEMIPLVLISKYTTLLTQGNLTNELGLPMTLFQMEADTEAAVIEMGMNHFGEISRLSRTARPTIGVITNIGISHIENLGSREGILKAKMELTEGLADSAPLILNGDDALLRDVKQNGFTKITYGMNDADYQAVDVRQQALETCFTVAFPGGRQEVVLPAVGMHHVSNALAAFAVGHRLGVDPADAAGRLSRYQPEGMRQRVISVGGRTCIEDCYNASPDSMKAALVTLRQVAGRRRIAVLADMLELGAFAGEAHEMVGRMAADSGADALYAYGDAADGYVLGAKSAGMDHAQHFVSKEDLAEKLSRDAQPGDVILFKASRSMKMEEVMHSVYERWKTDE